MIFNSISETSDSRFQRSEQKEFFEDIIPHQNHTLGDIQENNQVSGYEEIRVGTYLKKSQNEKFFGILELSKF